MDNTVVVYERPHNRNIRGVYISRKFALSIAQEVNTPNITNIDTVIEANFAPNVSTTAREYRTETRTVGSDWNQVAVYGRDSLAAVTRTRFQELAARWHADTGGISAPSRIVSHDAYLQIISMGLDALPLILEDLRKNGGYWYPALRVITGAWPVPAEARGKPRLMKEAWFLWAREERGYDI